MLERAGISPKDYVLNQRRLREAERHQEDRKRAHVLSLVTGFLDDRREPLGSHHALYDMAAGLRARQDSYSDREHRVAFMTALEAWPRARSPQPPLRETKIAWAGMLLAQGYGRRELVAYVLGIDEESVRKDRLLELGETWRDEVLRKPPRPFVFAEVEAGRNASRLPRVVEGHYRRSLLTIADDELPVGDCAVNLPASYRPPAVREAEDGYLERLLELRTRQPAGSL